MRRSGATALEHATRLTALLLIGSIRLLDARYLGGRRRASLGTQPPTRPETERVSRWRLPANAKVLAKD